MITAGRETSEYWKAMRVEILGDALVLLGLVGGWTGALGQNAYTLAFGSLLVLMGSILVERSSTPYLHARGELKAASVRRPVDVAPKRI